MEQRILKSFKLVALMVVLGVSALPNSAAAQLTSPLELEDLKSIAVQRALDVLITKRDQQLAVLDADRLAADLKPQIRLNATVPSYFSSFRETVQPDGTVRFQPVNINNSSVGIAATQAFAKTGGSLQLSTGLQRFDDFEQNLSLYNGSVARLGYNQPIFGYNDFKWRKQITPIRLEEADASAQVAQQEAEVQATQLFFALADADLRYTIADSNTIASERLLEIAKERFELGKISRGDLVQLELDLASARQNRLAAQQLRISATANIYAFIGEPFSGVALSTSTPSFPTADQIDGSLALALAAKNRPEAFAKARRTLEAESQLEFDKRSNGFQANLSASVGLIRSDPNIAEVYADPQTEQVVELRLSVPLVDWGRRKSIVKQSEAELVLAKAIGQRAEQSLATQVSLVVAQYNQAKQQLTLLEEVRTLADERYQISRESYVLGAVPLTDLTLAQVARDTRKREYLFGLQTAWIAYEQLTALTLNNY